MSDYKYDPVTYSRHDALGIYVRFGISRIVSYTDFDWGGIYYREVVMETAYWPPLGRSAIKTGACAFEVRPWVLHEIPAETIATLMHIPHYLIMEAVDDVYDQRKYRIHGHGTFSTEWSIKS